MLEDCRENADVIQLQMMTYLLDQRNYEGLIKQFTAHLHAFKNSFTKVIHAAGQLSATSYYLAKIEEHRWRANWHLTIAKMLEARPVLFVEN
jgi:hypothetical protein